MRRGYIELARKGFQPGPDPRFHFASAGQRRALAAIGCGMARNHGVVVITGPAGCGKSMLVAHVLASCDAGRVAAAHLVGGAPRELPGILAATAGSRRCSLLLLDDVERCPPALVTALARAADRQARHGPAVQLVLLASSRAAPPIGSLATPVHHYEMPPLSCAEVPAYIEHRLILAGWSGEPGFSPGVRAALLRYAGGLPRQLNRVMRRLLLLAARDESRTIGMDLLQRAVDVPLQAAATSGMRRPVLSIGGDAPHGRPPIPDDLSHRAAA